MQTEPNSHPRRFRVALSFPGEKRAFVRSVATHLAQNLGIERVLYDEYYESEFARPDLDIHLQSLYHDDADLIAVFLCHDYARKEWPGLEWRAIRDLIKKRHASTVMPLRFDNAEVPGLFSTDGYVWIGERSPEAIADVIMHRLNYKPDNPTPKIASDRTSENQVETIVDIQSLDIEITIDGTLESFSASHQKELLGAIDAFLQLNGNISIKRKRRGSIKLTIELRADLAEKLKWAIKAGFMKELGVKNAEVKEVEPEKKAQQSNISTSTSSRGSKYLEDIGIIDADRNAELVRRIKQGDNSASEKLLKANIRFVVSVAKNYQNQGVSLPDLINEGCVGLLRAAHRFDETQGFKFISYAVWWIRQSILQALAEESRMIRLPMNQVGLLKKINEAFAKLEQEFERPPSLDELAKFLDLPPEKVGDIVEESGRDISMDVHGLEGKSNNQLDEIPVNDSDFTDGGPLNESLAKELNLALSVLTERERDVVKLYFGIGVDHSFTLEEIGAKLDLTRENVRKIKEKAIRRMRHTTKSKILKAYLS